MKCNFCGTENPEDAVYCGQCGKRLDEKAECKHCGRLNPAGAIFCNGCGKRLVEVEDKTVPPSPAESDYRPDAVTSETDPEVKEAKKRAVKAAIAKALRLAGGISAIVGVAFAVLFTFLIGVTPVSLGAADGTSSILQYYGNHTIYSYFGEAYANAHNYLAALAKNGYTGAFETSVYLPVVLGTAVSAGTIVSVITLAILSAVRFFRFHTGAVQKGYGKLCIATVLCYLAGTLAFQSIHTVQIASMSMSEEFSALAGFVRINGASIAGIVLCLLCLLSSCVCQTVSNAENLAKGENLPAVILSAVGIVFTIALIACAASASLHFIVFDLSGVYAVGCTILLPSLFFAAEIPQTMGSQTFGNFILAYSVQIFQIVLIVLAVFLLLRHLLNFVGKRKSANVALSSVTLAFAVIYLVLSVTYGNVFLDTIGQVSASVAYTSQIEILIFGFVSFGVSIGQELVTGKKPLKQTQF